MYWADGHYVWRECTHNGPLYSRSMRLSLVPKLSNLTHTQEQLHVKKIKGEGEPCMEPHPPDKNSIIGPASGARGIHWMLARYTQRTKSQPDIEFLSNHGWGGWQWHSVPGSPSPSKPNTTSYQSSSFPRTLALWNNSEYITSCNMNTWIVVNFNYF